MRLLLQRVKNARVDVDGQTVGSIGAGLLAFLGLTTDDHAGMCQKMIEKTLNLRLFDDDAGVPNRSLIDISGDILVVSQFTLYASCKKGRRPSYSGAMPPAPAEELYEQFVAELRTAAGNLKVETGSFGAMMDVRLVNDGPMTIWLDSSEIGIQ